MIEIIAEIGQNHNGDMCLARDLICAAKEAGADVAKFQIFDARALFSKNGNPWYEYNLKTELTERQVVELAAECRRVGIEFMASVFDPVRVGWLEELKVKRYKVASCSIRNEKLLQALTATAKPLIVSLGQWNEPRFPAIATDARVDFLYCVSKYPTPLSDVHLSGVDFTRFAGFSDHTVGINASVAAMARGARIIEKHFTLDRNTYGPDHICSMSPEELRDLCRIRNELRQIL
ncbi:N-acetylneuraminate synthase family protein [bacterium]|nr:N-acetylneuraminate synthase family protein [bacterium]MBU1985172.1 N-acetylneuraminate synthase family protein [bacterium]